MSKPKYTHLVPIVETMPPLSVWPDRSAPYAPERSEVNLWVMTNCDVGLIRADRIRNNMAGRKAIVFDPETKLWRGRGVQTSV
jgi:hypothetical protein